MTRQQSLIRSLVYGDCSHLTADEIYLRAKTDMPGIGLATVYRCLKHLCERGDIRRVVVAGEPDRFDKTINNHEHAVCRLCGRMRDVDVGDIASQIASKLGERDFNYELSIHDLCPECRERAIKPEQFE